MLKITILLILTILLAHAEETSSERADKHSNNAIRAVKKGVNRVEESLCMDSDLKCLAKKAGNRVEEAKDSTVDGAKAVKAKLD